MLIDWFTVGAQALNFLILVWLLKRYLYKPVLAAIDQREKRIAAQLQDAEKKKADAQKEQTDFARKNEDFEQKRGGLLLDATNAAKAEREKLLATARTDSDALRTKLQKAVKGEADSLNKKIGALAQKEVFSIARKTLSDLAGVSLEERMTTLFVQRLQNLKSPERDQLKGSPQAPEQAATIRTAFDLPAPQRTALEEAVKPLLHDGTSVEFATKPDLISGIELAANGQKIAWSIADYLAALARSVDALVETKTAPAPELKVVAHAA